MDNMLKQELNKAFKLREIYVGMIATVIFACLNIIIHLNEPYISSYQFPITAIKNLTNSYMIIIFLAFSSYIFGVEIQNNTLKIIKSKPVRAWKFILVKFGISFIYCFFLTVVTGIIVMGISLICYSNVPLVYAEETYAIKDILIRIGMSYLLQYIAVCCISTICMMIVVCTNSTIYAFVGTFLIMIFSKLGENISIIKSYLPSSNWLIWKYILQKDILWQEAIRSLFILMVYACICYFITVRVYDQKQINH